MTNPPTVLVVIDAQEGFRNSHTAAVVPSLVAEIRAHAGPILFTRFVNQTNSNFERLLGWAAVREGPATQIMVEVAPLTSNKVIFEKSGYSAFSSPAFSDYCKSLSVQRIKLCGFDTDACVLATALNAFDLGYETIILADACGSSGGGAMHAASIEILTPNLGKASIVRGTTNGWTRGL